jgi:hypothetical protein
MGTIKRKKRHVRPGPKVDLIEVAMCGGDQDWSAEELAAIKHEAERIGAEKWLEGFLAEHDAWTPPPEVILSDEDGARILAEPCAYVQRVPDGFQKWVKSQPDGPALWAGWLEEIRLSRVQGSVHV